MADEKQHKYKHCSQHLLGVLAENMQRLRKQRGWSQERLAEKANMHRTFISLVERRGRNITLGAIEAIANALEVEVYELLTPSPSSDNQTR